MRVVGLSLILVVWVLGTGGCAPSDAGSKEPSMSERAEWEEDLATAKKTALAGEASEESDDGSYAQGAGARDPEQAHREYRRKIMGRYMWKRKKSKYEAAEKETDAERWWRELWQSP